MLRELHCYSYIVFPEVNPAFNFYLI